MMEVFDSLEECLKKYPDAYVAMPRMGDCRLCSQHKDIRCGVCWDCMSKVTGEKVAKGKAHKLWEIGNPDEFWYVPA